MGFLATIKKPAPDQETIDLGLALNNVGLGNGFKFASAQQKSYQQLIALETGTAPQQSSKWAKPVPVADQIATIKAGLNTAIAEKKDQIEKKAAVDAWVASVGGMHHQSTWKHIGRQFEKHTAEVVVPVTAITAAALATIPIFGTVASIAVTQAGGGIARVTGAGAAREEGLSGHAAKDAGRQLAKKTRVWGARGGSLGSAANAVGTSGGSAPSIAGAVQTGANVGISISHDGNNQPQTPITISTGGGAGAGGSGSGSGPSGGQGTQAPVKDNSQLIALGAFALLATIGAAA